MIEQIKKELKEKSNAEKAKILQKFFKTGKGEYGEGDVFLGISVPVQREIAKRYSSLPLAKISSLLESHIHEERMTASLILTKKYKDSKEEGKGNIVNFYLKNSKKFNNWDLVDLSAPKILGDYILKHKDKRKILFLLSKSKNLWERRISIVSTWSLIRENQFEEALEISENLLQDKEDLILKAVGWMLREIGKKEEVVLRNFIKRNYPKISRITLRYAIEKFEEKERKNLLKGVFQ
jgi:3-methyladenine DNA glycosylase AlkD